MSEQPPPVGAPREVADAQEMPGCISGTLKVVVGIPILTMLLIREIITLPLDLALWVITRLRRDADPPPPEK
ncbi:MAG: hypothetical protein HC915_10455 [Anaerolineae bacterium]|nr:hypothetical protein [Anaerolineae bacterium]